RKNSDLLEFLIRSGHIKITEEEIMENLSHSDPITKIIAVIQTAWFLLQIGARASQGLAITELEIVTVGFAVLNFGTYFLWWNKPLRVRHPVRVYWRHQVPLVAEQNACNQETAHIWDKICAISFWIWVKFLETIIKGIKSLIAVFNFLSGSPIAYYFEMNKETLPKMNWVTITRIVSLPFLVALRLIFVSTMVILDGRGEDMAFVLDSSRLQGDPILLYVLVYVLTTLFGAIHCVPWNFQFPTQTEQLFWRISAGGLVVLPTGAAVMTVILTELMKRCGEGIEDFLRWIIIITGMLLLPIAYFVARVILMVLALMELRDLPPSAYQTVQWTTFIPHIG
ncbi:hypothetical protein VNI00_019218, partial [Paramarasmius palmivorus]